MGWFDRFKKTKAQAAPTQTKSYRPQPLPFAQHLYNTQNYDLLFIVLVDYYMRCQPYSDAINKITGAIACLVAYSMSTPPMSYI